MTDIFTGAISAIHRLTKQAQRIDELEARVNQAGAIADQAHAEQARLRGIIDQCIEAFSTAGVDAAAETLPRHITGTLNGHRDAKLAVDARVEAINAIRLAAGVPEDVPLGSIAACIDGSFAALRSNAQHAARDAKDAKHDLKQWLEDIALAAGLDGWTDEQSIRQRANLVESVGQLRRDLDGWKRYSKLPTRGAEQRIVEQRAVTKAILEGRADEPASGEANVVTGLMDGGNGRVVDVGGGDQRPTAPAGLENPVKAPTITVDEEMFRGLVRAACLYERSGVMVRSDGTLWDGTARNALELARKIGFAPPRQEPSWRDGPLKLERATPTAAEQERADEKLCALREVRVSTHEPAWLYRRQVETLRRLGVVPVIGDPRVPRDEVHFICTEGSVNKMRFDEPGRADGETKAAGLVDVGERAPANIGDRETGEGDASVTRAGVAKQMLKLAGILASTRDAIGAAAAVDAFIRLGWGGTSG